MKKKSVRILAIAVLAGAVTTGCQMLKDVKYTVTPDPLEMHGDSVEVTIDVVFPEKALNKKAVVEFTPMIGDTPLKPVTIVGEKATANADQVIPYKAGGSYQYKDKVAYKADMEESQFDITGKIYKGTKEKGEVERTKIADATTITPYLVNKDFRVIYAEDQFKRVTQEKFEAQINFEKGKHAVRATELKEDDIKALEEFLKDAQTNERVKITSINIVGFASPEGGVESNSELSNNRSQAAQEAVMKIAKAAANEAGQAETSYALKGSGEDFSGFEKAVNASTMNEEDKALVIRVIKMEENPNEQEASAHQLASLFKELDKDIFPALRRAEITVNYDKTGWSDDELKDLSNSKPDTLTLEELLYTATLYTDLNEKARVYAIANKNYGKDDYRASNNLGAAMYEMNKTKDAQSSFESANGVKDNPISKNNLGAVAGVDGDREKAMDLFDQANGAGDEVSYNKGILHIQNGAYTDAISAFGSENTFNKALALICDKNASAAVTAVNGSEDAESAQGYYLKAIAAARSNDESGVINNLKSAVAADSNFKAKAARDREFVKFYDNASFTAIVQ